MEGKGTALYQAYDLLTKYCTLNKASPGDHLRQAQMDWFSHAKVALKISRLYYKYPANNKTLTNKVRSPAT